MTEIKKIWSNNLQKRKNQELVFKTIKEKGPISLPGICYLVNLSRPTVEKIVDEYTKNGLVQNNGVASSNGGRKPALVKLNPKAGFFIGIDFEIPHLNIVLVDLEMNLIHKRIRHISYSTFPSKIIKGLEEDIKEMIKKIDGEELMGISIGLPGLVDVNRGVSVIIERLKEWKDILIVDIIQEEFDVPVYVDNDVNMMALAEKEFGIGKGVPNMIYIALRSGIGSSIFINHQLYRGNYGNAGLLGHIKIERKGPLCQCGSRGCLELIAGEKSIIQQAKDSGKNVSAIEVLKKAKSGEQWALKIVEEIGEYLGIAVSNLVKIFDIQFIVIGDKAIEGGQPLLDTIRKYAAQNLTPLHRKGLEINFAKIRNYPAALGAALRASQEVFRT